MLRAYFNYPNPHITLHSDTTSKEFQKQNKQNQRLSRITLQSFSTELSRLNGLKFGSNADENDLWLEIDFGDRRFEIEIYGYVRRLLGGQYSVFTNCQEIPHC